VQRGGSQADRRCMDGHRQNTAIREIVASDHCSVRVGYTCLSFMASTDVGRTPTSSKPGLGTQTNTWGWFLRERDNEVVLWWPGMGY
jgi:hypothetical protein